jgi:hypothetical protein
MTRRDHSVLIVRFLGILVLSPLVAWMLLRAWEPGTFFYGLVWDAAALFDVGVGDPNDLLMSTGLGLYFGLLAFVTLDWRKRVQGALMLVGSLIGLAVFAINGTLLPNIAPSILNLAAGVAGFVAIALLERSNVSSLVSDLDLSDATFDTAVSVLFILVAGAVIVGYVQATLIGEAIVLVDTLSGGAMLYLLVGFFSYESEANTAVVGPKGGGKSTLILGLYYTFTERTRNVTKPTLALDSMSSKVDDMDQGDRIPIAATSSVEKIGFYHVVRGYFPKRIRIGGWDHTGEMLNNLADRMEADLTVVETIRNFALDVRKLLFSGDPRSKQQRFFYEVRHADLALLLIDVKRVQDPALDSQVKDLRKVGRRVKDNGGDVIVVATKVDLIREQLGLEGDTNPEEVGIFEGLTETESFRERVTEYLRTEERQIDILLGDMECDVIHPVYYEYANVDTGDGAQYRPVLDENGDLQPVGHDHLAEEIERRF